MRCVENSKAISLAEPKGAQPLGIRVQALAHPGEPARLYNLYAFTAPRA